MDENMDENKDLTADLTAKESQPSPETSAAPETPKLEKSDVFALILGLALSILWFYVFSLMNLFQVPAWGTTAFVLSALASEAVCLRGRLRPTRAGLFLAVCTVLLAVAPAIFPDYRLRLLDLAALSFLTPATALALAGRDFPAMTVRVIPETFRLFIPDLFRHIPLPFRALRRGGKGFNGFWVVVLTLFLLLPVLILILSLLSSADAIFSALLGRLGEALTRALTHFDSIWRVLRTLVFALMLFSFLHSLSLPVKPRESAGSGTPSLPALPFIAGLAALDLIYAVFAAIQLIFLFGGAETALLHGGYAQYARSGFFELVAVSAINLTAAVICFGHCRESRAVRALVLALLALTGVILISALTRMCLYIGAYGMSLLRAGTLFIMAWLAAALIASALKALRPDRRIFPALFAIGLALLIVINYVNIDGRIAQYNYRAYKSGALPSYDYSYLASLGPTDTSTLPAPCRPLIPNSPPRLSEKA